MSKTWSIWTRSIIHLLSGRKQCTLCPNMHWSLGKSQKFHWGFKDVSSVPIPVHHRQSQTAGFWQMSLPCLQMLANFLEKWLYLLINYQNSCLFILLFFTDWFIVSAVKHTFSLFNSKNEENHWKFVQRFWVWCSYCSPISYGPST